jgi:hypothetical protein
MPNVRAYDSVLSALAKIAQARPRSCTPQALANSGDDDYTATAVLRGLIPSKTQDIQLTVNSPLSLRQEALCAMGLAAT